MQSLDSHVQVDGCQVVGKLVALHSALLSSSPALNQLRKGPRYLNMSTTDIN
jgi:hypothetical protein